LETEHLPLETLIHQVLARDGAGSVASYSSQDISRIFSAHPQIFRQTSVPQHHISLNTANKPVLINQLLALASNVEVAKTNRYRNGEIQKIINVGLVP
jgi:hypothetical protein